MSGGLKGLTLNTPPEEVAHILAEDDAAIFQSIAGEDGVFTIGQQCKATTLSNNKIRIADGVVIIGGHFARIPYGDYEDCEIENGESGKKRNDIIVAVFETTGTGGIDKMHCTVKKGVAGSTAADPELKQDDIYNNGKIRELPLYRVKIEGLSIVAVEQMFKLKSDMTTINKSLSDLSKKNEAVQNDLNKIKYAVTIHRAPQENYSYTFHTGSIVPVGNIEIPTYSKGIFVSNGGNDGALFAIDVSNKLYIGFRNGTNWSGRII